MANRKMLGSASRIAVLLALSLHARAAFPAEYTLRAGAGKMTMPDGTDVPMWGFACVSAVAPAVCARPGVVTVPGPALVVPPGDSTLIVNLTNQLAVPVSIVIPGQPATMTPVWTDGSSGPRTSLDQRVRSFTAETAASGGTRQYTWTGLRPGTFLYHSGTHPQVQVQMGLYGAVVKRATGGTAYPGVGFDREHVLLFSEIDPALHAAVAGPSPTYGTPAFPSTIDYRPRYFLVNGAPFTPGGSCLDGGAVPGERNLLRMLNAGLRELAPMVLEAHWDVVAEGGSPYRITTGAGAGASVPRARSQYSALLPPGGTVDVVLDAESAGVYRILDRRLYVANGMQPDGGFQTCVAVGPRPPATGVTLAASLPSPQAVGTPVTFVAAGQGSSFYQYRFWLDAGNGPAIVQDFGVASSWTMPPTTAPGTYRVIVHVRSTASATWEARAELSYTIVSTLRPPATGVTLAASAPSPQPAGTAVTFTATGQGSSGYQYRFWLDSGSGPVVVQDYGVGGSWTLPASTPPSTYRVIVHVRTNAGTTFDARAELGYTLYTPRPPATGVTLTPSLPSPQLLGTPVAFAASGQGSSGYQYRFWLDSGSGPVMVQDYGVGASWTLPGTAAVGTYRVIVHVRTTPASSWDARAEVSHVIVSAILPPATGVTLSPSAPSPRPAGTAVTFTAAGQGSSGYQYRFWLDAGAGPVVVQDYGVGSTWVLPATTVPGSYRIIVHVRTMPSSAWDARAEVRYAITGLGM